MVNNNIENKKEFTRDCTFIEANLATGEQFKKIATLRSKDGPITEEQAKEFYDQAREESKEWQKNHPGESVLIRVLENGAGEQNQVIEVGPKNDFIGLGDFRARIYDVNTGELIVSEENKRKENNRRKAQWEK